MSSHAQGRRRARWDDDDPRHDGERADDERAQPSLGNQALQRLPPALMARVAAGHGGNAAIQRLARGAAPERTVARNGHQTYPSKEGIEYTLTPQGSSTAIPNGYRKWLYPGGRVYMRDRKDPLIRMQTGWNRSDGYEDLVKHTTEDQGRGSCWISTTTSLDIDPGYGPFLYEIELTGMQGIDVNPAVQTLSKHRNPHAQQNEIAVYKRLPPEQIKAIWVKMEKPPEKTHGFTVVEDHERYTPQMYIDMRKAGLLPEPKT